MKLHIGCGKNKEAGFIGVDRVDLLGVDKVVNYSDKLPFDDNSADEIICSYVIEYVPDLTRFMEELFRIAKNKSHVKIVSTYYTHIKSSSNPLFLRSVNEWSFIFCNKEARKEMPGFKESDLNFQTNGVAYRWCQEWLSRSEEVKEFAKLHYWNVIEDIMIDLITIRE